MPVFGSLPCGSEGMAIEREGKADVRESWCGDTRQGRGSFMAPPSGNESSQDLSSPNFHQSIKACTITSDEAAHPRSRRAGRTTPVCLWWKHSFRLERGHFIHQITPRRSQEPFRHPSAPLIHRLQDRDFLKRKAKTYIRGHHMMPPASPKSRPRSGCHRLGGVMQGTCFPGAWGCQLSPFDARTSGTSFPHFRGYDSSADANRQLCQHQAARTALQGRA